MLSPNLAYILGYLWSWKRFRSLLVGTHDSSCWFLEYVKFLVYNRQSGFPELHSYRKHSKIQSILDYVEKMIGKRINNGFGNKIENIQLFCNNLSARVMKFNVYISWLVFMSWCLNQSTIYWKGTETPHIPICWCHHCISPIFSFLTILNVSYLCKDRDLSFYRPVLRQSQQDSATEVMMWLELQIT